VSTVDIIAKHHSTLLPFLDVAKRLIDASTQDAAGEWNFVLAAENDLRTHQIGIVI
jgi:hypothetical protein